MKATYRLFALLLCAAILCGCSGPAAQASAPTEAQKGSVKATEAPTEAPTEASKVTVEGSALGQYDGTTYTNDYMGVSATFGDGWTYYTADQLQEIPAAIEEMITDTELGDSIEAGGGLASITTMMCENVTELITVNVVYQKLSLSERLMYATMDSEKLADLLLGQKDSMIEAYKAMGMEVSAMEAVEVTYLGQTRSALRTAAKIQGIDYYFVQVYDFNLGGSYGAVLTAASYYTDRTQEVLDMFTPLS